MRLLPVFGVAMSILGSVIAGAAEHTTESLETVKQQLAQGKAVIVDVRESSEWDEGHLKDARLLSLSRLRKGVSPEELDKILTKDKVIYAHCAAGGRCLEAADRLKKAGFEIRPLKPGFRDLLAAGFEKAQE
ncbi:MAG: rhodanese [Planctomycetales bacterium 12-60-4]|nr:MAG: rhodanese [Planctomycetales bacterium 12-60-4]